MLNKQGPDRIDWTDYTWNPVKGLCKHDCDYCYTKQFYRRFKHDPTVRLDEKTLNCRFPKKPAKVFVCSSHDLFGDWIDDEWIIQVIKRIKVINSHIIQCLDSKT